MEIISLDNINVSYDDKCVLKDVSLSIIPGEFVLVCGPTGSGKTTLLKKLYKIVEGKASYVTQSPDSFLVCDKVRDELAFGLRQIGVSDNEVDYRVAECSGYFGISSWLNRDVATLSGGEKQILTIACAMTKNPKVLILDEPTAMLDPIMTDRLIDIITRLNAEYGITIIISEHKPDNLYDRADKVMYVAEQKVTIKSRDEMARWLLEDDKRNKYLPLITRTYSREGGLLYTVADARKALVSAPIEVKIKESYRTDRLVLEARDIAYAYEKDKRILDGISFKINEGEIVSLLGENGCGKTTFATILAGGKKPYEGKVKVYNKASVGMMYQDVTVHFMKDEYEGRHPYDLSGGERQKLALSLVLKNNPKVLILDEPAKGLDPYEKEELINRIVNLSKEGMAIIIVTHDIEMSCRVSDRMVLMHGGRIVKDMAAEEFVKGNIFYTTSIARIGH